MTTPLGGGRRLAVARLPRTGDLRAATCFADAAADRSDSAIGRYAWLTPQITFGDWRWSALGPPPALGDLHHRQARRLVRLRRHRA